MKKKILIGCLAVIAIVAAVFVLTFFITPDASSDPLSTGNGLRQEAKDETVTQPPDKAPSDEQTDDPEEPDETLPDAPEPDGPTEEEPSDKPSDETDGKPEPEEPEPEEPHRHSAVHFDGKDATCTDGGKAEYWYCPDCGKYFADGNCTREIGEAELFLPPKGHNAVTDEAVAANCERTGLTEGSHCADCGEVFVAQQITPRLAHDFVDGYCTQCGEWQVSDGLTFEATDGGYAVTGFGSCASANVRIPETFAGLPVVKIGIEAFSFSEEITAVYVPASVKEVGEYAFYYCTALKKVYFEDGATEIGESAFDGCENLKDVRLPETLKALSANVFASCCALEEIYIPESVKSIGAFAFGYCTSLKRVTVSEGTEIDQFAFMGCSEGPEIYRDGIQQ